jgi:geranylgeranyl reductase family protein
VVVTYDALVVGAGPAGAATAFWLARQGRRVLTVEKQTFPRDKTCGDGLTPRAVHQLLDMGLSDRLRPFHRFDGLRATGHGQVLELQWPSHSTFPSYGYVVRRCDLDAFVADHAVQAGAELRQATTAVAPLQEDGVVVGATLKRADGGYEDVRARFVVVAEGAKTTFGRALGVTQNRSFPQGMALRGYYRSARHDDPWIESALDLRDRNGHHLPGYGWIFPVGNGTINVGVGLLSTFKHYKQINTTHLLDEYVATAPEYWGISADSVVGRPTGGRLPMGGSVGPKVGPGWLLAGDSAGTVNPFNGEGIDYAYETGRMAAELIDTALRRRDPSIIGRYPDLLDAEYGRYFKVARLFAKVIGRPALMRELTRVGLHSTTLMEWVLRIMANLLRDDEIGAPEAVYKAVAALARLVPER